MEKALPGVSPPGRTILDKFERFNASLSAASEAVALAAVVFMVLLTCVDVLGAKLFLRPVPGSLDMMMLAQLVAVTFAAAATLLAGRHVAVDFFVALLPERSQARLALLVELAALVLFGVIAWRLFAQAFDLQASHEVSPTAAIPLAPFAYAAALAIVPVCLVLVQRVLVHFHRLAR
jgi:TRAP-type C4-dicarboxylate transport system permease small subunit